MSATLLPARIDNTYRGHVIALWLFGVVVTVRMLQSLAVMFNGRDIVRSADGVPVETFPADAAQAVVSLFALIGLHRLFLLLLCVLVLVRYRSAIPFMFAVLILNYLAGQLLLQFVPLVRVGAPVGPWINFGLFLLLLVGLALSLRTRTPAT